MVLSNKYLEVIIQSLEPKLFKEKVEDLFNKIKKFERNLNFLIKYLKF